MDLNRRLEAFSRLGSFLLKYTSSNPEFTDGEDVFATQLQQAVEAAKIYNNWFTEEDIRFNLRQWGATLALENLEAWVAAYDLYADTTDKRVAVIMAGNIPLVGFHDFLSVLVAGHKILVKQSSKDQQLLPVLAAFLVDVETEFDVLIKFTKAPLSQFDAVIATGSDNAARYFEYYFKDKPHIIRRNRNSVAVLSGKESKGDFEKLGEDIFRYFGLGCRNVSKLLVPEDFDFSLFFEGIYSWHPIINTHKYANNYDYNKAVYLMSDFKILDNGFLILKEDEGFASPIAVLFYQRYADENQLAAILKKNQKKIQCVVLKDKISKYDNFGYTQKPSLSDYSDNIDTLNFLIRF